MSIIFSTNAWEDYLYWQQNDKSILKKINALIKEIQRIPFEGKGKPEPLKYELSGYWSCRINTEHRLIYKVESNSIYIIACSWSFVAIMSHSGSSRRSGCAGRHSSAIISGNRIG